VPLAGPAEVELVVPGPRDQMAANGHVPRSPRLWPVARRVVSEGRDRLAGLRA
jgi:hypothetical protein